MKVGAGAETKSFGSTTLVVILLVMVAAVAAVAAAVAVAVVVVVRGRGLHPFIKPRCNASCFGAVARGEDVRL